jgi:DNA polymerase-3 subunit epsilon
MGWLGALGLDRSRAEGWAVVDLETTGLFPSHDRVVEVAVVSLDPVGRVTDSWVTLVDPGRDLGPTHIHGLTGRHIAGAPTFADVAPELLWRLSGRTLVAHNVRFDLGFLHAETQRLGIPWGPVAGVCTMSVASQAGAHGRSLVDCCESLGIPLGNHHCAFDDAHAAAGILAAAMSRGPVTPTPPAPGWPQPLSRCSIRLRTDPPLRRALSGTVALASRVGVPQGISVSHGAVLAYLDLLDRVLEDRCVTDDEVRSLASMAGEWGISADVAAGLHCAYLSEVWRLARADGIVTPAELQDIETLAELLGVPTETGELPAASPVAPPPRSAGELVGRSVCFTGESICCLGDEHLEREDQEMLAEEAGLIVKSCVSRKLDILVLADPDSQSGKARKARELGVRCIAEPVFWRALGVQVDVV